MNNLELEITSKVYNDMDIISEFIAQDNKSAANKMMKLFYKTFETFLKHPNIGTSKPDFTYMDVKFYVVKKVGFYPTITIFDTKHRTLHC